MLASRDTGPTKPRTPASPTPEPFLLTGSQATIHTHARAYPRPPPPTFPPTPCLQALVSHLTTPGTLLLSATPLSVAGTALPLLLGAQAMTSRGRVLAVAVLTGLGNSMGWVQGWGA